jgi:Na+/phosphate symporter
MIAFIISVVINVIVTLIFCFPIVVLFHTAWNITRIVMYRVFRVNWYTHEENVKLGRIPREYTLIADMVTIKLEEEIHKNFEHRKKVLARYEKVDKDIKEFMDDIQRRTG